MKDLTNINLYLITASKTQKAKIDRTKSKNLDKSIVTVRRQFCISPKILGKRTSLKGVNSIHWKKKIT